MTLRGKKALVTGACGFIGSHLVEALQDAGCSVRAFVFYDRNSRWGWLDTLPSNRTADIEVVAGDVRDAWAVRKAAAGVDLIFHLAALVSIPYSYVAPESYVDTNVKGTLNVLSAGRDVSAERILITSTSEVYGSAQYVPIDESHPRQGQSPYSASKIGADMLAESFVRSYSLPAVIVRPFNTFGPRQSPRAIIPAIVTQLLAGKDEIELGYLQATRDFNFVLDTVQAFLAIAATTEASGREINIATQTEISIETLARLLIDRLRPQAVIRSIEERLRPENSEVQRLCGSSQLLRELTGWQPQYAFEQAIDATIDWYRQPGHTDLFKADLYHV